jgi:hypothetical protein
VHGHPVRPGKALLALPVPAFLNEWAGVCDAGGLDIGNLDICGLNDLF